MSINRVVIFSTLCILLLWVIGAWALESPVGHWKLDETTGSTAFDSVGSYDAALQGGVTFDSGSVPGKFTNALSLDGIDDYAEIPALNLNSNTVTITAWVKRDGSQNGWAGIVFNRAGSSIAGLNFGSSNELRYHWNGTSDTWGWDSGLVVPDDTWTFGALVVEPDKATIYMNDGTTSSATSNVSHAIEEFDDVTCMGRDAVSADRSYCGAMDDVRIYDVALTSEEIGIVMAGPGAASQPDPADGAEGVELDVTLGWTPGDNMVSQSLYFGTDPGFGGGPAVTGWTASTYGVGSLDELQDYYWRVDTYNGSETVEGVTWSFTTGTQKATNPNPADTAEMVTLSPVLSWTAGLDALSHNVYFGSVTPPPQVATEQTQNEYSPESLETSTTYFWRVDENTSGGVVTGDTWSFTTRAGLAECPVADLDGDCAVGLSDLNLLAAQWLADDCSGWGDCCADIANTGDGVNVRDYAMLAEEWLEKKSPVIITELMAVNVTYLMDEDGDSSDWIELYNVASAPVDLNGWYLTDDPDDLNRWEFPAVEIQPDGFLLVFASGKDRRDPQSELHTDFALEGTGEFLALVEPDGETIASVYNGYPQQFADISYGLSNDTGETVTETTLLAEYAGATAFIPEDDSLGLTWTERGFDDSGWLTGATGVGYDTGSDYDPLINLDVEAMKGVNETVYARVAFGPADSSEVDELTLRMKYEDGFIAYLNGYPVTSSNAPDNPTWDSGSTATRADSLAMEFADFDITDNKGLLRPDDNVLAVHGLNATVSSSDLLILPELVAKDIEPVDVEQMVEGYFLEPTAGGYNTGLMASLGPAIREVTRDPVPPGDGEDLSITAEVTETFEPVASVTLHYRTMYETEASTAMYDDGMHGDGDAGDGVYGATIPADISGPGEMVRWYVTAEDTAGKSSRAPLFPYADNSAEYYGTVVVDPTLTSDMSILHWFVADPAAADTRTGTRASIFYNGEFYDNVFVRIRGGTSGGLYKKNHKFVCNRGHYLLYDPDQPRVQEININAAYVDNSYMREILSQRLLRDSDVPSCYTYPVRVEQNGSFHSLGIFVEQVDKRFLERHGLNPEGSLYKAAINDTVFDNAYDFEAKNDSDYQDMETLCAGLALTGEERTKFMFDNLNIPEIVTYLAMSSVCTETDHFHKNYYMHFDEKHGQWYIFPWDRDLSWGHQWNNDNLVTELSIYHNTNNLLFRAIFWTSRTHEMYVRRLRTLMDEFLQPSSTPVEERVLEPRIEALRVLMKPEADMDRDIWGFTDYYAYDGYQEVYIDGGAAILTDDYLPARRTYMYNHADIPGEQPSNPKIYVKSCEYNPASANQDEEYIELWNNNSYAVDISGWRLEEAVEHTFDGGTVIEGGGYLYVSPDMLAFKNRSAWPTGGQGLYVRGNYNGHLSNWGETIKLVSTDETIIDQLTYPANPSDQQRYLRITEIMYNPAPGGSYDDQEYEFIELKNIGTDPLLLDNIKFSNGIYYTFTDGAGLYLSGGDYIVVVKNQAAFASHYDTAGMNIAPGEYSGYLDNGGEQVDLDDLTNSTILGFDYKDGWYDITDGGGFSLTIKDANNPDLDSWDSKSAWRPSAAAGGSPCADDSGVIPELGSVVINELLAHSDVEVYDWIELHNTTGAEINIGGWFLSDDNDDFMQYEIAEGTSIPANGYVVFYEDQHFGNVSDPGCHTPFALSENGETVYVHSGQDGVLTGYNDEEQFGPSEADVALGRYEKSTGTFNFVAMSSNTRGSANAYPKVGPIVISEIMYHHSTNGDAEYVELYNVSGSDVTLYDSAEAEPWRFTDDENDPGVDFLFPSSPAVTIAAGERILLVKSISAFNSEFSAPQGTQIFEWVDGNLSNGGEKPELQKPGDVDQYGTRYWIRVDRISYDDEAPWPLTPDGDGDALERINATLYGNDPVNWQAASPSPGQ